jgi:hypothetical protein
LGWVQAICRPKVTIDAPMRLNHQVGTISGVAAVYQRHEFFSERRQALALWGAHIGVARIPA